jgi:RHS repeat-associated protein
MTTRHSTPRNWATALLFVLLGCVLTQSTAAELISFCDLRRMKWEPSTLHPTFESQFPCCANPPAGGCNTQGNVENEIDSPESIGKEECNGPIKSGTNSPPFATDYPVDLRTGDKLVSAVDLVVPLPGDDFVIQRQYSSNPAYLRGNYIGYNWRLDQMEYLYFNPDYLSSGDAYVWWKNGGNSSIAFMSENYSGIQSADFKATQGVDYYLSMTSLGDFVLTKPGSWKKTYKAPNASVGSQGSYLLDTVDDMSGKHYRYFWNNTGPWPHLETIAVYSDYTQQTNPSNHSSILAAINFSYLQYTPQGFLFSSEQISAIEVLRPLDPADATSGTSKWVTTQAVYYTYNSAPISIHPDFGDEPGALVMVEQYDITTKGLDDASTGAPPTIQYSTGSNNLVSMLNDTLGYEFFNLNPTDARTADRYRRRVTMYRYYKDGEDEPGFDYGQTGQLKSIFEPEQIEFWEQNTTRTTSQAFLALELLNMADADTSTPVVPNAELSAPYSSLNVKDLASKIAKYFTSGDFSGGVMEQILQTNCGCGSASGLGKKLVYTYDDFTTLDGPGSTARRRRIIRVSEQQSDGPGAWKPFRQVRYDMVDLIANLYPPNLPGDKISAPQWLTQYHIITEMEGTVAVPTYERSWVTKYEYFETAATDEGQVGQVARVLTPSSFKKLINHEVNALPDVELVGGNQGLVYHYRYFTSGFQAPNKRYVALSGVTTPGTNLNWDQWSNFSLIEEYDWDINGGVIRHDLPSSIKRFRDGTWAATMPNANAEETETTSFSYTIIPIYGVITSRTVSVERELETENGSGGTTYDAVETRDLFGDLISVSEPDGSAHAYDRSGMFGSVSKHTWSDGATTNPIQLVTEYTYDSRGRVSVEKAPSGAFTNYEYDMFVLPDDAAVGEAANASPNWSGFVPVYGMREYTPEVESGITPSGPVITTYYNAANKYLGRQAHSVFSLSRNPDGTINLNTSAQYPVEDLDRELERELALRGLDGLVRTHEVFHDLGDQQNGKYTTTYAYDTLGRLRDLTNPLGTVTTYDYDMLNRVINEHTTAGGALSTTTRQYQYDYILGTTDPLQDSSYSPKQGVGNGTLRVVREIENDTLGTERITQFEYDFRDRRIATSAGFKTWTSSTPTASEVLIRERLEYDNLDRVTAREMYSEGDAPNFNAANRGWREEYFYNQRGLNYQRKAFTDPSTASASAVVWNTWFDEVGRPIAQEQPNGPAVKRLYDGLGRLSKMYITDRGGDLDAGVQGSLTDASNVSGDTVLEQYNLNYAVNGVDGAGQVDFVESFRRAHNATLTGALDIHDANAAISTDEAQVIATYSATYFDVADRPEFTVEFGVGDDLTDTFAARGTMFTRPPRTTNPSFPIVDAAVADKLVTRLFYNSRSLIDRVREPDDQYTKYYYDDMNRQVGVYENADLSFGAAQVNRGLQRSSTVPWGFEPIDTTSWSVDKDRLTVFAYDGISNITHRVAYNQSPGGLETQVTQYEYGVSRATSGNLIDSNDLLAAVTYPDEFGLGTPKKVTYKYNGLGEVTAMTDQNGTSHAYTRDLLGRVTLDKAIVLGNNIDPAVLSIAMAYDKLGRLTTVGSYPTAAGTGTPVNEMAYAYNGLWQLTSLSQNPTGAVGTGDSAVVDYSYTASATGTSGTYQRLTSMLYPSNPAGGTRTDLTIGYDTDAVDSAISRASRLTLPDGSTPSARNVDYRFIGMGMPVVKRYDENSIQLDRWADPSASGSLAAHTTGTYAGLDRYGRIKHQLWINEANATTMDSWAGAGTGATAARFDMAYTYDNASDILSRTDARPGAAGTTRDERYTYDGLNRLIKAEHGVSSGGGTTFTPGNSTFSQKWDYDHLGNQLSVISDTNAGATQFDPGVDLTLARLFNAVNETDDQKLSAEGVTPATDLAVAYDASGNQTKDDNKTYVYDAWNRLVGIDINTTTPVTPRTRYSYYGLHQRATRSADADTVATDGIDEHNLYYYDAAWRLIEERVYDDATDDDVLTSFDVLRTIRQRVWGLTYIDELCVQLDDLHDGTSPPDGDMSSVNNGGPGTEELYYALCDRRYDVVELADNTGAAQERVRYSAYGKAWVTRDGDADSSGAIDGADLGLLMGAWGSSYGDANYNPDVDLNNDGIIDGADMGILLGAWGSYDTSSSGFGNTVLYAGYLYDAAAGLHLARFRWYDADRARWVTRDPIRYAAGSMSLFQYVGSKPVFFRDPFGLGRFRRRPLDVIPGGIFYYLFHNMGSKYYIYGLFLDIIDEGFYHEQYFYDDGSNTGYFNDSEVHKDTEENLDRYGPSSTTQYDDNLMEKAVARCKQAYDQRECGHPHYDVFTFSCQDFASCMRREYEKLKKERDDHTPPGNAPLCPTEKENKRPRRPPSKWW